MQRKQMLRDRRRSRLRSRVGIRKIERAHLDNPEENAAGTSTSFSWSGDAVVLARLGGSMLVRLPSTGELVSVRAKDLWHVMPGHVVRVDLQGSRRCHQVHATGEVHDVRIDIGAFGLAPLGLEACEPLEIGAAMPYEGPEALEQFWRRITAAPRVAYEMEQILPEISPSRRRDPILAAIDLRKRGDTLKAIRLLMDLLRVDLRCLDAHAHLGNFVFPTYPQHALIHYEIGVAIGEQALGPGFSGALPWKHMNNRPFLRCLHGQGLALLDLGRLEEAQRVFERLLWLDPADEQEARRCWIEIEEERPSTVRAALM